MSYSITRYVMLLLCLVAVTACNPVRMTTDAVGLTKKEITTGEKVRLKVPPEQAIKILDEVAAQNGWAIVSIGDQYDMQGLRGKYYRLETTRFIGGKKQMSGVFFTEPTGCFTVVGKNDSGLPTELVEPFLAATNGQIGSAKLEPDTSEPK